jgi:proteasome lid subunit RPN8/RPN11
MSGEPTAINIPRALLEAVYKQARAAFPAECCGWLEGAEEHAVDRLRACKNAQSEGDHPTASDRGAESAYVISGDDLLALNKSLSGPCPARVIYHSHPNGRAYFSDVDQQVARSPWGDGPAYPVQQLVVGIDADRVVEAALFAWSDSQGRFVEMERFQGAAL